MQEAFDKLRGVDIFSLKSYMEPTGFASFNGAWVLINELFVNFFFFILNAVVGFFSLLIRILEKIDLYSNYKNYVFNGAMNIWKGFIGSSSGGVAKQSLVSMLLLILAFYLFYQFSFMSFWYSSLALVILEQLLEHQGVYIYLILSTMSLKMLPKISRISRLSMAIINPLKLATPWQIAILQKPLIKLMSLSIQVKKMGNIRIVKMGNKKLLMIVRY